MKLRTEIERTPLRRLIGCREGVLLVGSCFTEHVGEWMEESWLRVMSNPWGVLFNPASIAGRLAGACGEALFPLVEREGVYYSFQHHGKWSGRDPEELGARLLELEGRVRAFWKEEARHVIVTFGTAWVYEREGEVVANCHKFPASEFVRRRLSVSEIVDLWSPLIEQNPDKHWVMTVSPIRHVRDGLHGNEVSKAVLLLAIEELQEMYPERVEYLPTYELLVDDLRDYRFYADDLCHPSTLAIEAVRELVSEVAFDPELRRYMQEAAPLVRALQHRPVDPESAEYQRFKADTLQRKDALLAKYGL